jgi:membrane protein
MPHARRPETESGRRAIAAEGGAAGEIEPVEAMGTCDRGSNGAWTWARPAEFWGLLYTTTMQWSEDNVPRLGAALAFYSVLSIAPLLLISLAVAAQIFGQEAATGQIVGQIRGLVGKEGAEAIQEMLGNARKPGSGIVAALMGFATLLFAASGVFGELQGAMNTIWKVQPKPGRGILGILKDRFFSFAMVLGSGFLLLTSLIISTAVAAVSDYVVGLTPALQPVLLVGDVLASAVVITLLFALIFKVLPDAKIAWRDVWVGAALTMVVFLVGKAVIGAYLGRSSYGSAYGAAGSLVVLVV